MYTNVKAIISTFEENKAYARVTLVDMFTDAEREIVHFDLPKSQIKVMPYWDEFSGWTNRYCVKLDIDVDEVEFI